MTNKATVVVSIVWIIWLVIICKLIDNLLKNPKCSLVSMIILTIVIMHDKIKPIINPMYASFFTMKNPPS